MRVSCVECKQITLTKQVRIRAPHQILMLPHGTISAMILPRDLHKGDLPLPQNSLLSIHNGYQPLHSSQIWGDTQLCEVQNMRRIRHILPQHRDVKYIMHTANKAGGRANWYALLPTLLRISNEPIYLGLGLPLLPKRTTPFIGEIFSQT